MDFWNLIGRSYLAWELSSLQSLAVNFIHFLAYTLEKGSFVCFSIYLGSILLLTSAAVAWDYCPREGTCSQFVPLTPAHYVQIILSLQTSILLPVCLAYSGILHVRGLIAMIFKVLTFLIFVLQWEYINSIPATLYLTYWKVRWYTLSQEVFRLLRTSASGSVAIKIMF